MILEVFLAFLTIQTECNTSPPVLNVQDSNQAPLDESPLGPDLGIFFGLDAFSIGVKF